jgi:AhpD family alkylhydroperoxidase
MDMQSVVPEAYAQVRELERYIRRYVDHSLLELVKLRASMVNGCAFCVDMHSRDAIAAGESTQRLFGLAAWHDSPFYSKRERAALALTDAVTHLGADGVSDEVWGDAAAQFDERELADLLVTIATINVWNRFCVATRAEPAS